MILDHLVYATPDLDATVAELERLLGVRPAEGGRHPGFGTRNRLVGLGGRSYLEIVGPDPEQEDPAGPRPFGIDGLRAAGLAGWALAVEDIDAVTARAREQGYDPGDPQDMSRRTPSGELLSWRLTPPDRAGHGRLVPFLIDWARPAIPPTGCRWSSWCPCPPSIPIPRPYGAIWRRWAPGSTSPRAAGPRSPWCCPAGTAR